MQLQIAKGRLFDADALNVNNLKLFPGANRESTAEQFAEQINKALSQIEAGAYTEVPEDKDD